VSPPAATLGPMTMLGVHVGAREDDADPVDEARRSGADGVQIFLADPQGWKMPKPHPQAEELRSADLTIFVHAPYVLNAATTPDRIGAIALAVLFELPLAAFTWRLTRRT